MMATRISRIFVLGIVLVSVFLLGARPDFDQLKILDLQYQEHNGVPRLVLYANLPFIFKSYIAGEGTLIIETDKADISRIANNYTIGSPIVKNISVSNRFSDNDSEVTEFIIKYDANFNYKHTLKGRRLFVEFDKDSDEILKPVLAKNENKKKAGKGRSKQENKSLESEKTAILTPVADKSEAVVTTSKNIESKTRKSEKVKKYELLKLLSTDYENGVRIAINFDQDISRDSFKIVPVSAPARFVIDFHGAKNRLPNKTFKSVTDYYSGIRTAQYSVDPYPISRIVFDQNSLTIPRYLIEKNWLYLDFGKPDATLSHQSVSLEEVFSDENFAESVTENPEAVTENTVEAKTKSTDMDLAKKTADTSVIDIAEHESSEKIEKPVSIDNTGNKPVEGKDGENTDVSDGVNTPERPSTRNPFILKSESLADNAVKNNTAQAAENPLGNQKKEGKLKDSETKSIESKQEILPEDKVVDQPQNEIAQAETAEVKPFVIESKAEVENSEKEPEPAKPDASPVKGESTKRAPAPENRPEMVNDRAKTETHINKVVSLKPDPVKSEESDIVEKTSLFDKQFPDSAKDITTAKSFDYSDTQEMSDKPVEQPSQQQQEKKSPALQTVDPTFETREITTGVRRYTGKNVSLVFESIPLSSLILLLGQMTPKNFLLDPSVSNVDVSISLRDIPWDQALDVILDYHGLGKIEEDNLIRIASQTKLSKEAADKRELDIQRSLAVPLRQITKPINYAKADGLAVILRRNISQKGEVIVDQRTNTLVISDIPSKVDEHLNLIAALDIPTKQVIIEARIVETTRDFINEFGMQYGFRSSQSALYGNATGLVFPNSSIIQGNLGDVIAEGTTPKMAVNLPAPSANTSILGSFSNLSGSFILDAVLQAAESEKKVRVLSRPRISASNNSRAEIKSGVEVPFQVIQNNTVSIRFREATLKLEVTPHITSDSTVIMDVVVDKSSLGIQTTAGFTIQTRQATSTIRVKDGGVAVIGGVLEMSDSVTRDGIPFLKDIPFIGRLFENRLKRIQNTELLIFISPKVIG